MRRVTGPEPARRDEAWGGCRSRRSAPRDFGRAREEISRLRTRPTLGTPSRGPAAESAQADLVSSLRRIHSLCPARAQKPFRNGTLRRRPDRPVPRVPGEGLRTRRLRAWARSGRGRSRRQPPDPVRVLSCTERSLLNQPQRATFRMDLRVHPSTSRHASSTCACAATYASKSASTMYGSWCSSPSTSGRRAQGSSARGRRRTRSPARA